MYLIVFLILIFQAGAACSKEQANTIFTQANNSYKGGKYEDAVRDYEMLIGSGFRSAGIYYNLGNSYLRSGDKAKAILYYERAFRIHPRDADIRSNLNFTRTLVEESSDDYNEKFYGKVFLFLRGFLSIDEMTYIIAAFHFLIFIFLSLAVYFRHWRKMLCYLAFIFLILLIAFLPSFLAGIYESEFQKKAVIMEKEVEVRFEPKDDATIHFIIYEGAVVRIHRSQAEWHQIKRYDGKTGWLKGDVFTVI